jgi:hypothetical protein
VAAVSRREAHIRELADKLSVRLYLHRDRSLGAPSGSYRPVPLRGVGDVAGIVDVEGWDGRSQIAYAVALHELGHAADGVGYRYWPFLTEEKRRRIVAEEARAWMFALAHSEESFSQKTIDFIMGPRAFGSYLRDLGNHDLPEVQQVIGSLRGA